MAGHEQIIRLYSELAEQPHKEFGWAKGAENAKAHRYDAAWFDKLPAAVWDYCAAVGNPFEQGEIEEGSTVLDLGCGAGVDLLVSALLVGERGRVIGVDITPKMVAKAQEHAKLAGFANVKVLESSFDAIDLEDESVDVVISNGAINLTGCKESVFAEIYRVLKPEGRIMFADMIDTSCETAEGSCCVAKEEEGDWANCVAGTLRKERLIEMMTKAGFGSVECTGLTHYKTSETTTGATFRGRKIPTETFRQSHWDTLFQTKDYRKVHWHQTAPTVSAELIGRYAAKESAIIDVGCGASLLADTLIDSGFEDLTLLDTSETSLEIVKSRLGAQAGIPDFVCSDIMNFESSKKFDLWHDRAVFHFLQLQKERKRYFEVVKAQLAPQGVAIISTFAVGGALQCAGLDIVQYDGKKMAAALPQGLALVAYENFTHVTPSQTEQAYSAFVIQKG